MIKWIHVIRVIRDLNYDLSTKKKLNLASAFLLGRGFHYKNIGFAFELF